MPDPPRLLAIMGSGETAPTMSRVHRELFARMGPSPVPAVLLDTPFGFQVNADDLSARAIEYFRESVQRPIEVASFRSATETGSIGYETMLNRLRDARYVFSGPGSPSYALAQWRGTQVPAILAEKLRTGGCVTFASAAAVTLGPFALPVYEVYKVGQAPTWLDGLDLMAEIGLRAVVIPHFDNAEGGTHDTRYCYMGERRLRILEAMLPDDVFVLGVDEHTACILDLDQQTATVAGRGAVTVRRQGQTARVEAGGTVPIAALPGLVDGPIVPPEPAGSIVPPEPAGSIVPPEPAGSEAAPLLVDVRRLQGAFDAALAEGDPRTAAGAVLAVDDLMHEWSRDSLQSDHLDRARAALRSMVVRLGEAAVEGTRDPRMVVGPFVDALVEARARARRQGRWDEADELRERMAEGGVEVRDSSKGTSWVLHPSMPAPEAGQSPPGGGLP